MQKSRVFALTLGAMMGSTLAAGTAGASSCPSPAVCFDFTFAGSGFSGSGTFYTVTDGPPSSQYRVTHVLGTAIDPNFDSGASIGITGLEFGYSGFNLLTYPAGPGMPYLDGAGVGFAANVGGMLSGALDAMDIFYSSTVGYEIYAYDLPGEPYVFHGDTPHSDAVPLTSFTVTEEGVSTAATAVPAPSTWTMMALGFAALGLLGYRRRRGAAFA